MADQQKGLGERVGNEAHDAPDTGNPNKGGGRARTTAIAPVANDDRVDQIMSTAGGLQVAGVASGVPVDLAVSTQGHALIEGNIDHDNPDSGNPLGMGFNAAEFNSDPLQVSTDNDRVRAIATAQGIQFVLGGHPNLIRREYMTTVAQIDDPIIDSVAAGSQIIITAITVVASSAGSTTPQFRIGFGTLVVPVEPASGASVVGMVTSHGGVAAGSGVVEGNGSGIIAMGGDGMELRITNVVPTGGKITVLVTYYISTL